MVENASTSIAGEDLESGSNTSQSKIKQFALELNSKSLLITMERRLKNLELKLGKSERPGESVIAKSFELVKTIFTSWPALGFLFLILFFVPLRDTLNQLPQKIKSSTELNVTGIITLKASISEEAVRQGASELSTTLPNLSDGALRNLLVRDSAGHGGLVSHHMGGQGNKQIVAVSFPNKQTFDALDELRSLGLIELSGGEVSSSIRTNSYAIFQLFKEKYPGEAGVSDDKTKELWRLSKPLQLQSLNSPNISWKLTPLGSRAVDVVLQAIAKKLASEHAGRKQGTTNQ